ncbi:MAG: hypothetical protein H6745_10930 [Deltaproteobacteria bacterium]|nr:hypothetical protein [Deltaproteobacteria bacterium]
MALGACGSDGGGSGADTGATSPTDTTTASDADTTGTSAGDATTTTDTGSTVTRCTEDAQCATGTICACTGECVVASGKECTEDRNCGIPNWCNPCTGHCEEQAVLCEPCTDARGCQDDGACIPYASGGGSFCGRSCLTDAGAPRATAASRWAGRHEAVRRALRGVLELGLCETDGDCPDVLICNTGTGACYEGCTDDLSCPQGNVCQRGHCVPPCTTAADCTAPEECTEAGKCKVPGSCERKADCPTAETYCDKDEGVCKDGCLADGDCGDAAKKCSSGACVPRGCEHNYQCQFGYECNQASGQCEPTQDPHCGMCGDSGSTPCDDPRLCAAFKDENDVEKGEFCLLPCADDPIDQCPSGYQCQEVDIDDVPHFFCARACWVDPVNPGGN